MKGRNLSGICDNTVRAKFLKNICVLKFVSKKNCWYFAYISLRLVMTCNISAASVKILFNPQNKAQKANAYYLKNINTSTQRWFWMGKR